MAESSRCSFYKRRESCLGTAFSNALAAASARALEGENVREIKGVVSVRNTVVKVVISGGKYKSRSI